MKVHVMLLGAILTTLSFSQESKPPNSAASQPAAYDLRISMDARALLVEVAYSAKGKMNVKTGATEITQTVDEKGRARWIDEVGDVKDEVLTERRTFLEAHVNDAGLIKDPGFEGVSLVFTTKGGQPRVAIEGSGRMLTNHVQAQLRQAEAVGLYTKLPDGVAVGSRLPFDGKALLATLIASSGPIRDLEGDLVLDRVDPAARHAFLSGTIGFTEDVDKDGAKFAAKYRVTLILEVDLESHDLVRAAVSGRAAISGMGRLEGAVSGEVDVDSKATAKPAGDVASAKARKPTFRENTHRLFGLEVKLPSCWLVLPADAQGIRQLVDSRVKPDLAIEVALIGEKADPGSNAYVKVVTDAYRKVDPKSKVQEASFPIGNGITFELTGDEGMLVRGCLAPLGDEVVRLRIVGMPDAVKKAESEFKSMQASMRKAKS